ncbi:hypothetical protein FSP39_007036, partial [Pinctada imbricata]
EKLQEDLPRYLRVGKYHANLWYYGQPKEIRIQKAPHCAKCKSEGHYTSECTKDWVCDFCGQEGHKKDDCEFNIKEKSVDSDEECDSSDGKDEQETEEVPSSNEKDDQETEIMSKEVPLVGKTAGTIQTQSQVRVTGKKSNKKKDKTKKSDSEQGAAGPMDHFVRAARGMTTPIPPRDRSKSKQRTPPSPETKEKKKMNIGKNG